MSNPNLQNLFRKAKLFTQYALSNGHYIGTFRDQKHPGRSANTLICEYTNEEGLDDDDPILSPWDRGLTKYIRAQNWAFASCAYVSIETFSSFLVYGKDKKTLYEDSKALLFAIYDVATMNYGKDTPAFVTGVFGTSQLYATKIEGHWMHAISGGMRGAKILDESPNPVHGGQVLLFKWLPHREDIIEYYQNLEKKHGTDTK